MISPEQFDVVSPQKQLADLNRQIEEAEASLDGAKQGELEVQRDMLIAKMNAPTEAKPKLTPEELDAKNIIAASVESSADAVVSHARAAEILTELSGNQVVEAAPKSKDEQFDELTRKIVARRKEREGWEGGEDHKKYNVLYNFISNHSGPNVSMKTSKQEEMNAIQTKWDAYDAETRMLEEQRKPIALELHHKREAEINKIYGKATKGEPMSKDELMLLYQAKKYLPLAGKSQSEQIIEERERGRGDIKYDDMGILFDCTKRQIEVNPEDLQGSIHFGRNPKVYVGDINRHLITALSEYPGAKDMHFFKKFPGPELSYDEVMAQVGGK